MYYSDSRRLITRDPAWQLVWLSLLGGILVNLFPYPDSWFVFKPDFVAMIIVYWGLRLRSSLPFALVFCCGILMDVAYTATLGQHAFAYTVTLAIAMMFRRAYLLASGLQKLFFVGCSLTGATAALLLVSMVFDNSIPKLVDFQSVIYGLGLWLIFPLLLHPLRRNIVE